eukprot:scaffold3440_cov135-Isochrysis_galbana.AAC.3
MPARAESACPKWAGGGYGIPWPQLLHRGSTSARLGGCGPARTTPLGDAAPGATLTDLFRRRSHTPRRMESIARVRRMAGSIGQLRSRGEHLLKHRERVNTQALSCCIQPPPRLPVIAMTQRVCQQSVVCTHVPLAACLPRRGKERRRRMSERC